MVYALCYFSV
uniref:Uncharacterized protein n=1 Tax=Oryza glumipatula TaxID=40148 RepID=A0A0G2KBM9_9ORYZ